jgi:hypothetical protein
MHFTSVTQTALKLSVFALFFGCATNPDSEGASEAVTTDAYGSAEYFQIGCRAILTGPSSSATVTELSDPFTSDVVAASPYVGLSLGDITLHARVSINQPFSSDSLEPTLLINLFRGNPVQGSLSGTSVQGLDLTAHRLVGDKLSAGSLVFAAGRASGIDFSRIDYRCWLERIQ